MTTRLKEKTISEEQVGRLIKNNWTIGLLSSEPCSFPVAVSRALEKRFVSEGAPRELTVLFNRGYGEIKGEGIDSFGHLGMIKRLVGADYSFSPKINRLIIQNALQAYSFPAAVISKLIITAGESPGVITKLGIGSFVDPRIQGGRLNVCSEEGLVENVVFRDEEWLFYQSVYLNAAIIRAESANLRGDLFFGSWSVQNEAAGLVLSAKKNRGLVIAEVKEIVETKETGIRLPFFLIDYYIPDKNPSKRSNHNSGSSVSRLNPEWAVIFGRVVQELKEENKIFLERRLKTAIKTVLSSRGKINLFTDESNLLNLDEKIDSRFVLDNLTQFSYSGLLDLAILPFNQIDGQGNVNLSKYGHRITGCGRVIEVCQNSSKLIFCGSFTADGCSISLQGGRLSIIKDGRSNRFVSQVEQLVFASEYALKQGIEVMYITERAVFKLEEEGLVLIEIAPGVNLWRDILNKMGCEVVISSRLKLMDAKLFVEPSQTKELAVLG